MKFLSGLFDSRIWLILCIFATVFVNLIVYDFQLSYTNAYVGFLPVDLSGIYILLTSFSVLFVAIMVPKHIKKPSDFFLFFYLFFVVISFVIFSFSARSMTVSDTVFYLFVLVFPLIMIKIILKIPIKIKPVFGVSEPIVNNVILLTCLVGVGFLILNSTTTAGFELDSSYERRLEGRDIFGQRSLIAYLISNVMNGLIPFLAFVAGLRKNIAILFLCFLMDLSFFYVLGVKATFFYTFMAFALGIGLNRHDYRLIQKVTFLAIFLFFFIFLIEFFFNQYSVSAESFFRRIFVIPGFVVSHYMDLIFGHSGVTWSAWDGIYAPRGVTYLVGEMFFGNPEANANTNAFIYALASDGVVGYAIISFLILIFFRILDALYESSGNRAYMFIGFSYSLLITEQAATTAFVSSGIGLLFVLVVLAGRGWQDNNENTVDRTIKSRFSG